MNNKIRIIIIAGTRPEVIKLFPLLKELERREKFEISWISTGQHKGLLDGLYDYFDFIPDYNLDLMQANQTLSLLSSKIIKECSSLFHKINPDYVIVQGDTTTAMSAALAAFYNKIRVIHIEAGLRSFNNESPYPEEGNRKIISAISYLNFAPTDLSASNLRNERAAGEIYVSGNTVIDALFFTINKIKNSEKRESYLEIDSLIDNYNKLILITGHRRENFGEGIENICKSLQFLAKKFPRNIFLYPVHLNPNVIEPVHRMLKDYSNICLINPLSYDVMIYTLSKTYLVITDSGGIQEEAPSLNIPVLVTRDTTERQEGIESGCAKLIGTSPKDIQKEVEKLLNDESYYQSFIKSCNPYGDGNASKKIVDQLIETENLK
ncbi:non-hydrolyzing UDP-N-acetylglucosamine 2-epimerase [Marivirga sp.]|uniref:non-hydrolyzing UDP-N-acetylglucosamine 2-epimerase n=1 Tax=Marivirga sp. TaxID=2018662 RepID=UPI002D7EDE00|nr:UDP-N-acetylglucosamine 2-epimerase (non-hydrolyzing) [Marivirga sp.]HET8861518.1 UDP-N-acetylglucosamine 2-epimerase (non-hydrolyzing) [Marivirga sp.]